MSCGIASVNRTLCVLAAVWGLVPMAVVATGMSADPGDACAFARLDDAQVPAADPPEEAQGPCPLGEAHGLADTLGLATAYPNKNRER